VVVSILHQAGIVFGDLRDNNILYAQTDGLAESRVFLIDFDWADRDGEGRYPATLNLDSVLTYGIMRKAHDLCQVDRLKALCAQDI
jgi:serine/threonine protein kinase